MSDTCCQRHGYDDTGRYHVPEPEPKFPVAGNIAGPVNIPLDVQERLFGHEYLGIVRSIAMWLDECSDADGSEFDAELHDLALSRLRSGYEQYGSEMFTWDAATRRRNVLEELADAIVYLTSGPIE